MKVEGLRQRDREGSKSPKFSMAFFMDAHDLSRLVINIFQEILILGLSLLLHVN